MTSWSDTRIWNAVAGQLSDREATAVGLSLDKAQTVLKSSGTSPMDFTLHDHDHSFRVAERIFDLLPDSQEFGRFELVQLLLAAYVHDIGMSPSRGAVRSHYEYLVSGDEGDLTPHQIQEFRLWLDATYDGIEPPLSADRMTISQLRLTDEIVAYYSRHKHNDWSEDWARGELSDIPVSLYPSWVDDLVTLCRSHHEGLASLRSDRFDAKLVGSPSETLNLRYLAALLRVADVLEFDPERTPEVILERRDIAPKSRIYWGRDHGVSLHFDFQANRLLLSARTPSAPVHRAVLDTIDLVNQELATCGALEHEGLFRVGRIPDEVRSRYRWGWPSQLAVDLAEKDDSFVYIDGAFRPDSRRVIELLSGTSLYGDPLAAVRELIQNAVDAVKEQIAYERLAEDDPGTTDYSPIWSQVHKIRLTLEEDADGIWLRCVDDGVGMTKDIIENHMLVSGSASRVSVKSLEREVRDRGFSLGRTGQFGVGTLSYFMIADRLTLTTRQSAEAGDQDHAAWQFTTEGLGSFGELTAASRSTKGTDVRLRLRESVFSDKASIFRRLADYIAKSVVFLPCKLEFRDNVSGGSPLNFQSGWVSEPAAFSQLVVPPPDIRESDDSTSDQRDEAAAKRVAWESIHQDAMSRIRWLGPEELTIPDLAGRVRVWLPYFELEAGNSSVYLQTEDASVSLVAEGKHYLRPETHIQLSWRGFRVADANLDINDRVVAQVDLGEGASISVDRLRLNFPNGVVNEVVRDAALRLRIRFANENSNSHYNLLNLSTLRLAAKARNDGVFYWRTDVEEWAQVSTPFTEIAGYSYNPEPVGGVTSIDGHQITRLLRVGDQGDNLLSKRLNGGRLALTYDNSPTKSLQPAIVWETAATRYEWSAREFPSTLDDLLCVFADGDIILNANHPYAADAKPFSGSKGMNLSDDFTESFLRSSVIRSLELPQSRWQAIHERDATITKRVVDSVLSHASGRIDAWVCTSFEQFIVTIDREGHHFRKQDYHIRNCLLAYDDKEFALPSEERHWVRIKGAQFEKEREETVAGTVAF